MEPTGCPETSVRNYHYSLRNNPEERSFHLLRTGSLKSRNISVSSSARGTVSDLGSTQMDWLPDQILVWFSSGLYKEQQVMPFKYSTTCFSFTLLSSLEHKTCVVGTAAYKIINERMNETSKAWR
jgi:hypothetical protein